MRQLPDYDSLEQHIKRANFWAYIQRHPDLRRHPFPISHGWELVNGCCRPKPALPISLQVQSTQQDGYDSDSESESQSEFDFDTESESANDFESFDELELD